MSGYDVVLCEGCGFGYADNAPDQMEMDAYYKDLSKYEQKHQGGKVSTVGVENYEKLVAALCQFVPEKSTRIADIGCATGALLSVFQEKGYRNLKGIDPSPSCAETASELYGLDVLTSSLFDLQPDGEPFDALIFSSVMEHVIDLAGALKRTAPLLRSGGFIFIDVPDTLNFSAWFSAPFQQFSVEHVNFFSPTSLANLLRTQGFAHVATWHEVRTLGAIKDPALCTAFRKTEADDHEIIRDNKTEAALRQYIELSLAGDAAVRSRVDSLVKSERSIVVWGTGTQVQRLLASTDLGKARIRAFVDSNANYHGKTFNGLPIISPIELPAYSEPIVICTQVYQEEIALEISDRLRLPNEVIRLFAAKSG